MLSSAPGTFLRAARLALGTLTRLPVGPVSPPTHRVAGRAMLLAPVAVIPVAVVSAGAGVGATLLHWPPLVCGLLVIATLAFGTGALHLDGLADTVDGLAAGGPRERALNVMRRGDIGPFGVLALVLVVPAQAAAAGALITGWPGAVHVATLICCSRAAVCLACVRGVPAARPDGLGAAVAGSVPRLAAAALWLAVAIVLSGLAYWAGQPWWRGLLAAVVALAVVAWLLRTAVRRLGGLTGDVIGASVELALVTLLLASL